MLQTPPEGDTSRKRVHTFVGSSIVNSIPGVEELVERANIVFLYDDEGVIYKLFPEFRCDDSKNQPLEPLQDGFGDEPRYRGAHTRTLDLLVVF